MGFKYWVKVLICFHQNNRLIFPCTVIKEARGGELSVGGNGKSDVSQVKIQYLVLIPLFSRKQKPTISFFIQMSLQTNFIPFNILSFRGANIVDSAGGDPVNSIIDTRGIGFDTTRSQLVRFA